jgi:hypothetical protein
MSHDGIGKITHTLLIITLPLSILLLLVLKSKFDVSDILFRHFMASYLIELYWFSEEIDYCRLLIDL